MHIDLGKWTEAELDKIIREAFLIEDAGSRIEFLSGFFIGLEYKESTLLGNISTVEVFVINFSGVDCFTFIDYIEAMRLSDSFESFKRALKQVRYLNGLISFKNRKHFFTDWSEYAPSSVDDLTAEIGGGRVKSIAKSMNLKENGTPHLQGVESFHRTINYIPSEDVNSSVLQKLKTGDYAGIYSAMQGLDVSHVGIIIRDRDTFSLRHASSDKRSRKVVDQELQEYITGTPGLIILRPRDYRG
ncbi:MAG: N-acetylmuramoyl-L-alanine amidase-like domain-containing protein [Thermodesulfovibrionales bacterium]